MRDSRQLRGLSVLAGLALIGGVLVPAFPAVADESPTPGPTPLVEPLETPTPDPAPSDAPSAPPIDSSNPPDAGVAALLPIVITTAPTIIIGATQL